MASLPGKFIQYQTTHPMNYERKTGLPAVREPGPLTVLPAGSLVLLLAQPCYLPPTTERD